MLDMKYNQWTKHRGPRCVLGILAITPQTVGSSPQSTLKYWLPVNCWLCPINIIFLEFLILSKQCVERDVKPLH